MAELAARSSPTSRPLPAAPRSRTTSRWSWWRARPPRRRGGDSPAASTRCAALFAFTAAFFAEHGVDAALLSPVDFAIEELFTNMVKYGRPGGDEVERSLARIAGGVDVALTDYDVEPFDLDAGPGRRRDAADRAARAGGSGST